MDLPNCPNCPKCQSEYTYADGDLLICPECEHEWKEGEVTEEQVIIKDANGNVLADGDSVTVIKDLKIKGSSSVVKVGTKVKISVCCLMLPMGMILIVKSRESAR